MLQIIDKEICQILPLSFSLLLYCFNSLGLIQNKQLTLHAYLLQLSATSPHFCNAFCHFCFFQEKEEAVERLARETEKLAHADFEKAEDTVVLINKLQVDFRTFISKLDDRKKILAKTYAFYKSGHKVLHNNLWSFL